MSNRHRSQDSVPVPRMEVRAHAHNERHRIGAKLHQVADLISNGVDADDVLEPGPEWKPTHHHDVEKATRKSEKEIKHWKSKAWKRRNAVRKAKAQAWEKLREAS